VLFIGAWLGGCAIIDAEKNNRGGFLDEIADDWMKADSKKMRALRAVALEASLARIAMISPKSAPDRALLARRIGETTKRADMVRQCAFGELPLPGQLPGEPCFFFDSVMVDYENALFDLALIALPLDEVKTLMSRVSGGVASVSINPLQLVQALLDIGREAFRYGRVVGAIYRDTLELEVQVWLTSPGFDGDARIAALGRIYTRGNDDVIAWRTAIKALHAEGLEPVPQPRFIVQLYGIIGYICGQIIPPNPKDLDYLACTQPDLRAKIPTVNLPGSRPLVLGGMGTGGPGSVDPLTRGRRQPPDSKQSVGVTPPVKKDEVVEGASTAIERQLKPKDVQQFQALLCLPEDGKLLQPTRVGIRVFKTTSRLGGNASQIETNDDLKALLDNVGRLGKCDSNRFENYYERTTLLSQEDVRTFQSELNRIPNGAAIVLTGDLDKATRDKIQVVRAKLNVLDISPAINRQVTNTFRVELRKPR
jgi:hypothetical protein